MELQKINLSALWETVLVWSPKIVGGILVLIIGFWITGTLIKLAGRSLGKSKVDKDLVPFLLSALSVVLKILVVLTAASVVGIQITAFAALLGGLAIGVGAAMSGSLGHIASGIMLIIFKPYRVGDLIKVGDFTGVVREVGVFETVIVTFENKRVHIPNGEVTSGAITNISGEGKMRADMFLRWTQARNLPKSGKPLKPWQNVQRLF
ncbi:MAG: mechanosensitive ion channel [Leadbetterella sp.]|nr:mechanosensitive ion channel [Leadbetterella sp.]